MRLRRGAAKKRVSPDKVVNCLVEFYIYMVNYLVEFHMDSRTRRA